jgi:hypothetical protein
MKRGMQTYFFSCFLCFQEQSLSHGQKDPGSGIRKQFIPDPEGKEAPDPGSATLVSIMIFGKIQGMHLNCLTSSIIFCIFVAYLEQGTKILYITVNCYIKFANKFLEFLYSTVIVKPTRIYVNLHIVINQLFSTMTF